MQQNIDVLIVGGGPAGLSAALALARGRKHVVVADGGARRNAAATHVHNFLTRDGTPPDEMRRVAEEQLRAYPDVEVRHEAVASLDGERGAFRATLASGASVTARRVLLATGMVDEMPPIEGFRELWGRAIFQCPYCHGFEVKDRRWAFLAHESNTLRFAIKLRGWTRDVLALTNGAFDVAPALRDELAAAGVTLDERVLRRLHRSNTTLTGIELADGAVRGCDVLFAHPQQRQVDVVRALGVALDEHGFVRVDAMTRETSVPGIYAGGDLTSRLQGAIFAAAAGAQAAAALNMELTLADPAARR